MLCSLKPEISEMRDIYWDHEKELWDMDEILADLAIVKQESDD